MLSARRWSSVSMLDSQGDGYAHNMTSRPFVVGSKIAIVSLHGGKSSVYVIYDVVDSRQTISFM